MDFKDAVYKGFLLLPPVGKIILKKSWQQKYCLLFKSSKFGIQRIEVYDCVDKAGQPKIITLENVIKIHTRNPTYFSIITKTAVYEFSAISEESLNDWLTSIQSVVFPDDSSKITSIEEDNDLYCSSGEGIFNVKLHHSPASQRCGLEEKNYILVLTSTAIQLREELNNKLLYTWPYCYIRRYGYKSGKFTFEAGRKCESGEGTFFLEHSNQQEIFRCLGSKMKSMKKLLAGESTTSLLDCNDVQLHAALSMEARSRSPLPPSPTFVSVPSDPNNSVKSHINLSEWDIRSNQKIIKPKPVKPPRKFIAKTSPTHSPVSPIFTSQVSITGSCMSEYEPISKYDQVEYRNQAWKTLGLDNIDHKEQVTTVSSDDDHGDEVYQWGPVKTELNKMKSTENLQQGTSVANLDSDYDKLNFFGTANKLQKGYKQIAAPVVATPSTKVTQSNDYDEVQCIEAVRSADDSHLGYALIRKEPAKENLQPVMMTNEKEDVSHNFHNNDPYAIISKPKRV